MFFKKLTDECYIKWCIRYLKNKLSGFVRVRLNQFFYLKILESQFFLVLMLKNF